MTYRSSTSNDFQFFVSTVDPMPNRFITQAQHRPQHHVKFSDEYEDCVVEAPRTNTMPNRFTTHAQQRPKHHVKFCDEYEDRVVEAPRTTGRARATHYVVRDQVEDVNEEAEEFIMFGHKKFLINQQGMRND